MSAARLQRVFASGGAGVFGFTPPDYRIYATGLSGFRRRNIGFTPPECRVYATVRRRRRPHSMSAARLQRVFASGGTV